MADSFRLVCLLLFFGIVKRGFFDPDCGRSLSGWPLGFAWRSASARVTVYLREMLCKGHGLVRGRLIEGVAFCHLASVIWLLLPACSLCMTATRDQAR